MEHQSTAPANFPRRFFAYFCCFFLKYGYPVFPVVVFSHDSPKTEQPAVFQMAFDDGEVLRFTYRVVQLNRLQWRAFVNTPNPVASALMAKMEIAERDRPRVKLECLRLLATLKVNPERMRLISGFVDTYLRLNKQESEEFNRIAEKELKPEEKESVMEIVTSWQIEAREEGMREGLQAGRLEGQRQIVLKLLRVKFGPLPGHTVECVEKLDSADALESLSAKLFSAGTLEELGLQGYHH